MLWEEHCTYICDIPTKKCSGSEQTISFLFHCGSYPGMSQWKQIETLLVRTLFVNLNGGVRAKEARLFLKYKQIFGSLKVL